MRIKARGVTMNRMRTIQQAINELKAEDPNTAITYHFLRGCILRGELPFVAVGRKRLINMDTLEGFINKRNTIISRDTE